MPSKKKTVRKISAQVSRPARGVIRSRKMERIEEEIDQVQMVDGSRPVNRKRLLVLGAMIIGLGLLLFYGYKYLVIGWVDQTPLTRWQMDRELEKRYGKDYKDQVITETLILNEAKKRNVVASDQAISDELKKIQDQQGGGDKLNQILAMQNMTLDELKKQLKFQVLVKQMFSSGVSVSDDEVTKYIADNKEQFATSSDQVKAQVKDQLTLQKTGQAFNTWLTEAKSGKRVVTY